MSKLCDLLVVGQKMAVEYVENGEVIITAYWRERNEQGYKLEDTQGTPLQASQDVILDANWRIKHV